MKHAPGFLRLVEDARTRVREMSIAALRDRLAHDPPVHLLDVREHEEWRRGHLPGARHLCKGVIERDIEQTVPDPGAEIVLYCGGGFRSALAADNLQKMGYRNVFSMDGGIRDWRGKGYPLVK